MLLWKPQKACASRPAGSRIDRAACSPSAAAVDVLAALALGRQRSAPRQQRLELYPPSSALAWRHPSASTKAPFFLFFIFYYYYNDLGTIRYLAAFRLRVYFSRSPKPTQAPPAPAKAHQLEEISGLRRGPQLQRKASLQGHGGRRFGLPRSTTPSTAPPPPAPRYSSLSCAPF